MTTKKSQEQPQLTTEDIDNRFVAIDAITPHPDNYKVHPETQIEGLQKSHHALSQYRSVVVWERPGGQYIQVAGHGIVEAMKRNGVTQVRADVLPATTDPMLVKAILAADNLHAQQSTDDESLLARLLEEQQHAGFDLAALGSDEETLRQMLQSLGNEYLAGDGGEENKSVTFKEYDESIANDLDTEICGQCGKLCMKPGKGKK